MRLPGERRWQQVLEDLKGRNLLRRLRRRGPASGARAVVEGQEAWILCSNDYLGLSTHPDVIQAMIDATRRFGAGTGAARLISGNTSLHEEVEEKIARFKGTEAALFFTSGYHANVGTIQALAGEGDAIFSDELNHASIIDGCRLSRARTFVYRHRDMNHLEDLLRREGSRARTRLVVTDTVFSMDGDVAPLEDIVRLAEQYDAVVMVDEAHATGLFGEHGRGMCEEKGISDKIPVQMGTCGKALGVFGAYVAGSSELVNFLINRARSFIFTTAPPPGICFAVIKALEIVEREKWRRERVQALASRLRTLLKSKGLNTLNSETQIVPVVIGSENSTLAISRALLKMGFFVQGIRPPTVPPGTSRLRVTVRADLPDGIIEDFCCALEKAIGSTWSPTGEQP